MKTSLRTILGVCCIILCCSPMGQSSWYSNCGKEYRECFRERMYADQDRLNQIISDWEDANEACEDKYDERTNDGTANALVTAWAELLRSLCLMRAQNKFEDELDAHNAHLDSRDDVCRNNFLSCIQQHGPH